YLDIDARVGSAKFDNTHQFKGAQLMGRKSTNIKVVTLIDDDYDALRVSLWRWTDHFFREAQENYTNLKTNKAVTSLESDPSNDFSIGEKAYRYYEKIDFPEIDKKLWRSKIKKFSKVVKDYSFVYLSGVNLTVEAENRYIVTSEGTKIRTGNKYIRLQYHLITRTEDGMDLYRVFSYDVNNLSDLPSDDKVIKDIKQSVSELLALKNAKAIEPYSGPAILKNRASATFFHEVFGHRIEGHRQKSEISGQTFAKKIGQRVVSDIITITDDPTLERFGGQFLRGFYKFDNQGMKAQKVVLVENGILKNFLMSRSPIEGFPKSNGHGRRSPGLEIVSRMGNTIISANKTVSYKKLRQMLIEENKKQGKPYGLIIDDISGGFTFTHRFLPQSFKVQPILVYKVYPNGRPDEIVRGVDIVGTPLVSFGKIIAAADDPDVFNGYCTAESGKIKVSAVSPSILISEMEIEKVSKSQEKPPILKPPYRESKNEKN
ncbi:MAG TPA: TldD/PmbA family protein, partial [Elusimicrobiales bacterium]|nr:TldD/PmbA family protein [Elusimicrobiales bacterium]